MYNLNYLKLFKKTYPSDKFILADFYIESTLSDRQAAAALATESSIGTWTKVKTLEKRKFRQLSAKVYEISKKHKRIKVAYPLSLFEFGNIPQLLSSVAGNIFSLKEIKKLKLIDLKFPQTYINSFLGPKFGINGIRKITRITKRPLIGVIIKPKMGLSATQHAEISYRVLKNGADLVKDDENLTNQSFNLFKSRVDKTLKKVKEIEKKSKTKKLVSFNATAETGEMIKRAKYIKSKGGRCVMIDIVTCGFSGLQALRKADLGLIIHGHRAMHSAFTRPIHHGISFYVWAKLARLAGVDQLHTGTVVGKMEGGEEVVLETNHFLKSRFGPLKKVMPVASGGLHPGLVPELIKIIGPDVIINFGGGVHGHPDGSVAGVKAVRQAVQSVLLNINIKQYSLQQPELKKALNYFK